MRLANELSDSEIPLVKTLDSQTTHDPVHTDFFQSKGSHVCRLKEFTKETRPRPYGFLAVKGVAQYEIQLSLEPAFQPAIFSTPALYKE